MPVEPRRLLEGYDTRSPAVAVLGSHSALQILHGARAEGLSTVLIVTRDRLWFYEQFSHLVDRFVVVDRWPDLCRDDVISELRRFSAILVPHGSLVEYVGIGCVMELRLPVFGLRNLFEVEADQRRKMGLLREAGIETPKQFRVGEGFKGLAIVKLGGAKGGRGYFLARTPEEVVKGVDALARSGVIRGPENVLVQEYVVGAPLYVHFFYSPILGRLELMGADIRYESNADGIGRLTPKYLEHLGIEPSFVVVGNIPVVLRESLLPKVMRFGQGFVEATKRLLPPGIIGPFCLEGVVTEDLRFLVFEFSGRIVAGTNLYVQGSPYSQLYWGEPMSMGRRIAREIRIASEEGRLGEVVT